MHLPWLCYPFLVRVYSARLFIVNRIDARQAKIQVRGKSMKKSNATVSSGRKTRREETA
jgi:hypothetical protein